MTRRILPFGERALLVEVDALADVLALRARLAEARPPGVVDIVPAARTVLVTVDPSVLPLAAARAWVLAESDAATDPERTASLVELPVVYDGEDVAEVAQLLGITVTELVDRHAGAEWTVAFTGFAPGFGYLISDDWRVDVPRRASPRTRVPAGAVGLAGEFSGAYPRATPGGWQLIGTTSARLFDPDAATPALLTPGTRVRFVPTAASSPSPSPASAARPHRGTETAATGRSLGAPMTSRGQGATAATAAAIAVVAPGLLTTVQDLGRPGLAAEGIAQSGAADRGALRTANRLVGNAEGAAALEVTLGGFRAVAQTDLWFAVTGAWGPVRIDGRAVDPYDAHRWPSGTELHLDWFDHGARGYVAVRGGIDGPTVGGSRATDTLAGLGAAPVSAGDLLALAREVSGPIPPADLHPWSPPEDAVISLEVAPGPRADWFAAASLSDLFDAVWTVSRRADRVGVRLEGPALARAREGELPSEAMTPGAIQVPPTGEPVILGVDGPVTGGYPVVAVVTAASRDVLAQARTGTRVRFRHARATGIPSP